MKLVDVFDWIVIVLFGFVSLNLPGCCFSLGIACLVYLFDDIFNYWLVLGDLDV